VGFRLLPRDEGFYPLFQQSAENVAESARLLRDLLGATEDVESRHRQIVEHEHKGDEVTRSILHRLDTSFVTPFDREDIHALAEQLDDVVDEIQAAAELFVLHSVDKPLPEMQELADLLVKSAELGVELMTKLPKLRNVSPEVQAIDRLESEADRAYRRAVARLFSGELKAFDVLKLKDVVEKVEASVNGIEKVADIVQAIAVKHA
jgi:predicted phosphate transport protein (TIGR00153 family)